MRRLDLTRGTISKIVEKGSISERETEEILFSARYLDLRDVDLANEIIPDAGYYLGPFEMDALLSASMPDADIQALIARRKRLCSSLCSLLPAILHLFSFDDDENVGNFFMHLEDTLWDCQFIVKSERKDKLKRQAMERLARMGKLVAELVSELKSMGRHIEIDYERFFARYMKSNSDTETSSRSLADLERDLHYCKLHIQSALLRSEIDDDFLILSDRSLKAHLVQAAHWMSEAWGGPEIVTTPGSKFSLLCSFLLEAAGGPSGEGLDGVINRYARSEKRASLDAYNDREKKQQENLAKGFEDNFLGLTDLIEFPVEQLEKYLKAIQHPLASEEACGLLRVMVDQTKAELDATMNRYGPNLVWADRESEVSRQARHDEIATKAEHLRQLKLELGRVRRQLSVRPKK